MNGRGQKPGKWHRTKTYSSLRTEHFELRCERRAGGWIGVVSACSAGVGGWSLILAHVAGTARASREEAEAATITAAYTLAEELREAAHRAFIEAAAQGTAEGAK
jgi:hypothetical protein